MNKMDIHTRFMKEAITLASENVKNQGGPFGAVIVKNGKIIATGVNRVTDSCDPTAHAEVVAIRNACQTLQTFDLSGCTLYTSCEPCPMCLGAIYWARPDNVYYAATRKEAAKAGFDDDFIYNEVPLEPSERSLSFSHLSLPQHDEPFTTWNKSENKTLY